MSDMTYQWKPRVTIPVDAQAAGEHLEMLRTKCGGSLQPANVLEDARHNNSPLHPAFEWDDSAAAEKYRLEQAGDLIRALVVVVNVGPENDPTPMRAFVSVQIDDEPKYTSLARAMSDEDMRAQLVDRAWRELISWRDRYQEYKELARIARMIDGESKKRKPTSP